MERAPQRPVRRSPIRVSGVDGVTHQGAGEGPALALRDLGRKHRAGEAATEPGGRGEAVGESRWRVTPAGEANLAGLRDGAGRGA
jgi:hypothetical protein